MRILGAHPGAMGRRAAVVDRPDPLGMTRRYAIVLIMAAIALAGVGSAPAAARRHRPHSRPHVPVMYHAQGIGSTNATVWSDRLAEVGHREMALLRLRGALWRKLRAALAHTNLSGYARYCPYSGIPDATEISITAKGTTVCTLPGAVPTGLKPLVGVLGEIVAAGERRLARTRRPAADVAKE